MNILDNLNEIKKLDSKNMLGSLELLGKQVEQVWQQAKNIKIPVDYKKVSNVVVLGMGGSALGAGILKSVFKKDLKIPVEVVNGYDVPGYVSAKSLVVCSSYSGTTEEVLAATSEAKKRKAKMVVITAGGALAELARKEKIPALIFFTENNPCGSPRMGLGYSIIGQIILLAKAGILDFSEKQFKSCLKAIEIFQKRFGVSSSAENNGAKRIAEKAQGRSVWYAAAEHLAGNAHVAANQMNENDKRFAGYFLIPELNHHLMEGVGFPKTNPENLLFILLNSDLYDGRVQKRFEITKKVLEKNNILAVEYNCEAASALEQVCEVLLLGSYASFYGAILEGIDPTAIPFVDFFKEQLKH